MIPGNREHSHSGTVTVEKQQHHHAFFDEKITKNLSRKLEGCPKDVQRMTRGCPKDIPRMFISSNLALIGFVQCIINKLVKL
jgi:hypothetical protein